MIASGSVHTIQNHSLRLGTLACLIAVLLRTAPAQLRCDLIVSNKPAVGADGACLDLIALQNGGPAISVANNGTRISQDGFRLCKNTFVVKTGGDADIVFIYDNSSSMDATHIFVQANEQDTTFYNGVRGCTNPTLSGTGNYNTMEGPAFVSVLANNAGCLGLSGDPYKSRGVVIRRAIDFIVSKAATSTAGAIAFTNLTEHERPPMILNVPANVQQVKDSIKLDRVGDGTLYRPPLQLAKTWLANPALRKTQKRAIVFISDGAPSDTVVNSYLGLVDTGMAPIYSIFLGKKASSDTARLKQLSDMTQGAFYRVDPTYVPDIERVMNSILQTILVPLPPTSIVITNNSFVPPQVSRSTGLITNPDSSVSLVLDSILALKQGPNDFQVSIVSGNSTKNYNFSIQADGPEAGSSSGQLQCHEQPHLALYNPQGGLDAAYPSGPTAYDVVLTRTASDISSVLVQAVSTDLTQPQPWGDAENLVLPLASNANGTATNRKPGQAFNGAVNNPAPGNGILEAAPNGKVRLTWVHPRDPREFAVYELPGSGTQLPKLDLYFAGQPLSAVNHDQYDLEIRVEFSPGDTCPDCRVRVLPSGSEDREAIAVAPAGAYHNGTFSREMKTPAIPGDGRLQHLPGDSIVLVFENSRHPGQIVRRSYPFIPPVPVPATLEIKPHNNVSHPIPAPSSPLGRNWVLVAQSGLQVIPLDPKDKCCRVLPWPLSSGDSARYVGLTVESTRPFSVEVKVFSNLGQFVSQTGFTISEAQFRDLPQGATDSTRVMKVLWDNHTTEGNLAGTGAYVMKSAVNLTRGGLSYRRTQVVGVIRHP